VLVAKANPPVRFQPKKVDARRILASANCFADSVCTIKLSPRSGQGSTAKMLQCLQGDAFGVMNDALHFVEQAERHAFAFALQELRFAAQKLHGEARPHHCAVRSV
jgi:hypothetical protein